MKAKCFPPKIERQKCRQEKVFEKKNFPGSSKWRPCHSLWRRLATLLASGFYHYHIYQYHHYHDYHYPSPSYYDPDNLAKVAPYNHNNQKVALYNIQ